jgi:hypothetical protein
MLHRKAINRREKREDNTQRVAENSEYSGLSGSLRNPDSYRVSELPA